MSRHLRRAIDEIGDPGPTLAEVLRDEHGDPYALERPHTRTVMRVDPSTGKVTETVIHTSAEPCTCREHDRDRKAAA